MTQTSVPGAERIPCVGRYAAPGQLILETEMKTRTSENRPRHGSRLRTIVRKALATSSRVTTTDIAQLAYPNIWPLDKQHYRYARWALQSYARPVGRPCKGYGRSIIWEVRQ